MNQHRNWTRQGNRLFRSNSSPENSISNSNLENDNESLHSINSHLINRTFEAFTMSNASPIGSRGSQSPQGSQGSQNSRNPGSQGSQHSQVRSRESSIRGSDILVTNTNMIISGLTNPYSSDFDLTKKESITLFNKGSEGLSSDLKYDGTQKNGKVWKTLTQEASIQFCWGDITVIQNSQGNDCDLFDDFHKLKRSDVISHAQAIWSNGRKDGRIDNSIADPTGQIVQRRIKAAMAGKWIKNSMTPASYAKLAVYRSLFEFKDGKHHVEYDGIVMAFLLMEKIKPDTRVGAQTLEDELETMNLAEYDEDPRNFLTAFESTLNELALCGEPYKRPVPLLLDALVESKNSEFSDAMRGLRRKYDGGQNYTIDEIVSKATSHYNNIESRAKRVQRRTKRDKGSKTDTNSMVTLLTQVLTPNTEGSSDAQKALITALLTNSSSTSSTGQDSATSNGKGFTTPAVKLTGNKIGSVDEWRTVKVADSVFVYGRQYWWCPHHRLPGKFDGLYMTHKPGKGHDEWEERKQQFRESQKSKSQSSAHVTDDTKSDEKPRLALTDKIKSLKTALMTDFGLSDLQAEVFAKEHAGN